MPKKFLNFNSAYAQLILMVFLPISLLAVVGAYLVEKEANKAIKSEQQTLATAALIRYEPLVKQLLPNLIAKSSVDNKTQNNVQDIVTNLNDDDVTANQLQVTAAMQSLSAVKSRIAVILATMSNDQHIQRVAILDGYGRVVASTNEDAVAFWTDINRQSMDAEQNFISGISTATGTAYGHLLGHYNKNGVDIGKKSRLGLNDNRAMGDTLLTPLAANSERKPDNSYWLFVEMDDEPLMISRLRVWLGLGFTSLFTLLVLLLSLNIYAKRWIVPIYDLRLHLQSLTPDNMYRPVNTQSSGELNQLQQDLAKTLRRLYADFQELKNHAIQTEDDLRDAFDEMEMQNIVIRKARDEAISSSQAKSAFLANISHELRTPLNSIDGFINLLARHGNLGAEQDLYVQTIRKSSAHLLALVNDVLDFSKIEAGKLELDTHEFNLYDAIYEVVDMLSPLAAEKGLRMAVLYYNDVPINIIGDALRVKQVLTNLVGNAIKFTDVGEVIVRVGLDEASGQPLTTSSLSGDDADVAKNNSTQQHNEMIHIAVEDSGHGVPDAVKKQLFQSFSQGDPSITRQYGGTGLGLVISKQLTQLMGGQIGLYDNGTETVHETVNSVNTENNQGYRTKGMSLVNKMSQKKGATFWFSMPANVALEPIDDEIHEHLNRNAASAFKLPVLDPYSDNDSEAPFEILAWIQHTTSLQVFKAALQPLNTAITSANSLAGALEFLKEQRQRWDWVVIDGGDGATEEDMAALLKQVRLHYQGKLAIYGYQVALDATLLERYRASGLHQPLDKRQLYRLLDSQSNQQQTLAPTPTWQGVTVLAVDDHLPNLLVLDALLSELGIEVITANSGHDAIDIVSKQLSHQLKEIEYDISDTSHDVSDISTLTNDDPDSQQDRQQDGQQDGQQSNPSIDLIFMDIQMPRMSGTEATRHIRLLEADAQRTAKSLSNSGLNHQNSNKPNLNNQNEHPSSIARLPIIALTAQGLAEQKATLKDAGMDDYVGKPIDRPQLLRILQRWLSNEGEAATTDKPINLPSIINQHSDKTYVGNYAGDTGYADDAGIMANESFAASHSLDSVQTDSTGVDADNTIEDESLPVVDWQDALTRSANKPDLAKQLLIMMQETLPQEIKELQQAWEARDREQLALLAHRVLGASRYTGVPQIRETSQALEDKCLLDVRHTIPSQFAMLQPYYATLITSLQALQDLDLDDYLANQQTKDKELNEDDMTWKMI